LRLTDICWIQRFLRWSLKKRTYTFVLGIPKASKALPLWELGLLRLKKLWPMSLFLLFISQTMHINLFYTQQHCYVSLKTLHPGGIRTRVFCSWGRCDVHCATPPGYYDFLSKTKMPNDKMSNDKKPNVKLSNNKLLNDPVQNAKISNKKMSTWNCTITH
jgi:hypothetical protein